MGAASSLTQFTVLVFDVMGTVVDVDGPTRAALTAAVGRAADATLLDWNAALQARIDAVVSGSAPWRPHAELRAEALRAALAPAGGLPDAAWNRLDAVVFEADPWPDSTAALARLRESRTVVALSNASVGELAALSRHGGLAWHAVISGAAVRAYKPTPAVYESAIAQLGCRPAEMLMVAAHPWDLRAAAACGLGTAFVRRPDATERDVEHDFTVEVEDLAGLADLLG